MIVHNHTTRVDENRTTTILDDDPMFEVLRGSRRKDTFVPGDWEQVDGQKIVIQHFHRAFGNSRLTVELCEMEICGILHCMNVHNILQGRIQKELRAALGEESHVFHWTGWAIASLMEAMWWETDYLHEIKHNFRNCIGLDLSSFYSQLANKP